MKMNAISRLAGLTTACLLSLNATISFAQRVEPHAATQGTWVWIGDIRSGRTLSRDSFSLQGVHNYFRSIKFIVANATVHLDSMDITFIDGTRATIGIHADIPPGVESAVYDLPGFRHVILRIDIRHQTAGRFRGAGVVSVFGLT
jgi:hypothetical protein